MPDRAHVIYAVNGTTRHDVYTAPRISSQLLPDGGAIVIRQDDDYRTLASVQYSAAFRIEITPTPEETHEH